MAEQLLTSERHCKRGLVVAQRIVTALIVVLVSVAGSAQLTPTKKFKIQAEIVKDPTCQSRTWERSNTGVQFVDSSHFAVSQIAKPCGSETWTTTRSRLLIFSVDGGQTSASLQNSPSVALVPLPGSRFVLSTFDAAPAVYDFQQNQLAELTCPGGKGCSVFLQTPGSGTVPQLAVCAIHDRKQTCNTYDPQTLQEIAQDITSIAEQGFARPPNIPADVPATAIMDNSGNAWFTTFTTIVKETTRGLRTTLSVQALGLKAMDSCTGLQTGGERLLASCGGTHLYTDGDLDALFGYTRFLVIDGNTMRELDRLDRPAYTMASLSPDGRWLVLLHGTEIQLFAVK